MIKAFNGEKLMADDGFFNLINSQNISKIKKTEKKCNFLIIK